MAAPQFQRDFVSAQNTAPRLSFSADECLKLAQKLSRADIPSECDRFLDAARMVHRRSSKVKDVWTLRDGHGKREYTGWDNVGPNANGMHVEFMKGKSDEVQEKIRKLRTRMSMRGAKNVTGIDDNEVQELKEKELERRKSRREEYKAKNL
eukprot:maker-scaffold_16-snap-gene-6.36-mRNA-1 protein AED:0.02 eAED:0.02 QI:126/1/1/1/0.5/0.33/3/103/150